MIPSFNDDVTKRHLYNFLLPALLACKLGPLPERKSPQILLVGLHYHTKVGQVSFYLDSRANLAHQACSKRESRAGDMASK